MYGCVLCCIVCQLLCKLWDKLQTDGFAGICCTPLQKSHSHLAHTTWFVFICQTRQNSHDLNFYKLLWTLNELYEGRYIMNQVKFRNIHKKSPRYALKVYEFIKVDPSWTTALINSGVTSWKRFGKVTCSWSQALLLNVVRVGAEGWLIDQLSHPPVSTSTLSWASPHRPICSWKPKQGCLASFQETPLWILLTKPSQPFTPFILSPCCHGIGPRITRLVVSRGCWSCFWGKRQI